MDQVSSKETCSRAAVLGPNRAISNTKIRGCFQLFFLQCVLIRVHPVQNIAPCVVRAYFNIILSCKLIFPRSYLLFIILE
jgi:hypothetical protein